MNLVEAVKIVPQKQIAERMCEQFGVIGVPKSQARTGICSAEWSGCKLWKKTSRWTKFMKQSEAVDVPEISRQEIVEVVKTAIRTGLLHGASLSGCPRPRAGKMPRSPKLSFRSGFLNGVRLWRCPNFLAGTVSRWSLGRGILSGCVKAQTSSGSEKVKQDLLDAWGMIQLREPSSLRGFVNGVKVWPQLKGGASSFSCVH